MEKSATDIAWVALCAMLVFVMQPGFLCLEAGLTRSKNNINVAAKNLADAGICVCVFYIVGFGMMFGTSIRGWIGYSNFSMDFGHAESWLVTFFIFHAMFCATSVTIVSGAVAESARFLENPPQLRLTVFLPL